MKAASPAGGAASDLRILLLTALASMGSGNSDARLPDPAAVGRERPLTSTWFCENERSVLLNVHPRRRAEEAWLTYAGTRVAVLRLPKVAGISFASADDRVKWTERGSEAVLAFDGLLDRPVICRRAEAAHR